MCWAFDLEDYHPSVLLHCWLGHLTCNIVSEMTYNVSSGTLDPTIPYHQGYGRQCRSGRSIHVNADRSPSSTFEIYCNLGRVDTLFWLFFRNNFSTWFKPAANWHRRPLEPFPPRHTCSTGTKPWLLYWLTSVMFDTLEGLTLILLMNFFLW